MLEDLFFWLLFAVTRCFVAVVQFYRAIWCGLCVLLELGVNKRLHLAVRWSRPDQVKELLVEGVSPLEQNHFGTNALGIRIQRFQIPFVEILDDPKIPSRVRSEAVTAACRQKSTFELAQKLALTSSPHSAGEALSNVVHAITSVELIEYFKPISSGDLKRHYREASELIVMLVQLGARYKSKNRLIEVAKLVSPKAIISLVDAGADPLPPENEDEDSLRRNWNLLAAIDYKDPDSTLALKSLLHRGVKVIEDGFDLLNEPALMSAISADNFDSVKLLVENGSDVNFYRGITRPSPLDVATKKLGIANPITEYLRQNGAITTEEIRQQRIDKLDRREEAAPTISDQIDKSRRNRFDSKHDSKPSRNKFDSKEKTEEAKPQRNRFG